MYDTSLWDGTEFERADRDKELTKRLERGRSREGSRGGRCLLLSRRLSLLLSDST